MDFIYIEIFVYLMVKKEIWLIMLHKIQLLLIVVRQDMIPTLPQTIVKFVKLDIT